MPAHCGLRRRCFALASDLHRRHAGFFGLPCAREKIQAAASARAGGISPMILPVAARELVVAARRKSTFRARFLAALATMVVLYWQIERTRNFVGFTRGTAVFNSLAVCIWLFSLLVGIWLTSDCI